MKNIGLVLWTAPAVILWLAILALAGCATPAPVETTCPGFERITHGSGCRDSSGVFVNREKCSVCEPTE